MARRFGFAALLLAAVGFVGCAATREQVFEHHPPYSEDISYLYDDLASYGTWVEVGPYGWVWCPDDVSPAWQPYTVGYWIDTDDGWFWFSEDPWGSVPYHYGRWAFDQHYGWVWVPGDVWAPAWVAWRYGSGWVGWAPLPPDVPWQVHVGIALSSLELDRHIDGHCWAFTSAHDFGTHRTRIRVERRDRNEKLLKETRNVTRYAAGPRPVEQGMRSDLIHEIRGKKIERYRIVDSTKPVSKGGVTIRGRQAEVYRPDADARKMVRERVSVTPPEKRPDPTPSAVKPVEREREENETRVLAERVPAPREQGREVRGRTQDRETKEPRESALERRPRHETEVKARSGAERQKPIVDEPKRRIETKHEEVARPRQEEGQERQEEARERQEEARERREEARERQKEARERAADAEDSRKGPPDRQREVRSDDPERERGAATPEGREHKEVTRERKGESKEQTRGR